MKKIISVLLIIPMLFLNYGAPNSVWSTSLTERERALTNILGVSFNQEFSYDVDNSYKALKTWVEIYRKGVKDESYDIKGTCNPQGKGMFVFEIMYYNESKMYCALGRSSRDEQISQKFFFPKYEGDSYLCDTWKNKGTKIAEGKKIVVAYMRYHKDYEAINPLPEDFYIDYQNKLSLIKDDPLTILFCCEFDK